MERKRLTAGTLFRWAPTGGPPDIALPSRAVLRSHAGPLGRCFVAIPLDSVRPVVPMHAIHALAGCALHTGAQGRGYNALPQTAYTQAGLASPLLPLLMGTNPLLSSGGSPSAVPQAHPQVMQQLIQHYLQAVSTLFPLYFFSWSFARLTDHHYSKCRGRRRRSFKHRPKRSCRPKLRLPKLRCSYNKSSKS